ncbi:NAD-dependent epimerase/dehydratase family protein [Iamia sp.]|uniref:NAD-dependent epimerase/dehydratase family protein n=1 Tax=Iamia sp. TaxID=2722710 RepID=UPI002D073EAC|nr:NAD-dependent epimerase/dehydratase family protein [Iamia sp.]HXH56766.1 NAD-dependent epimerase/dehydratase family protein [Iamia sp.]
MRVFLTGATGVVGTRALPALVAAGHEVTAVARTDERAALVRRLGGQPVTVDLFGASAVAAAVVGHEAVVHLATNIPPMARSARRGAWATNDRLRSEASAHLVDAALTAGAGRYVQEAICFPYLDAGRRWIDEDSPISHDDDLFRAAGAAEAQVRRFAEAGGAGVVLRFAQFYAAGSSHTETMNATARRRLNPFIGDPEGYVSMIHADDAGSAVAAALEAPSGPYNIADDEPLTRAEAGRVVAAALDKKPPRSVPKRLTDLSPSTRAVSRSLRVSHHRFTEETGWTPAHPSIRTSWPTGTEEDR